MKKLSVGDRVKVSPSRTYGAVHKHLKQGIEYAVTRIKPLGHDISNEGGDTFFLDGGRCQSRECICNLRGWYLTNEFIVVDTLSKDEIERAVPLPSTEDVAKYFGIDRK